MNEEKDSFGFNFDEKYEDIIASMQQNDVDEYEDIVSDTSRAVGKHIYEDISSTTEVKGFKAWWKQLTKGKKATLISVASLLLVIVLLLVWFFSYFKYNYNSITGDPDKLGFSGVKDKHVINVALFGVDSRDETVFSGNTDSIMILSLNTKTKKVKIFSVMRDTFVPMEYEGKTYYGKINSAYAKGPEHAIKTINQIFDLDISEYATVNFYGMTDIINAVGGITATITKDELTWKGYDHPNLNNCMDEICAQMGLDPKDYYIHTDGEQKLNGVQAVAYARVRNCTSVWGTRDDFGRTDRQRHVMQQLFNSAITMKKTQYVNLIKALIPCSETSLSYSDVLSLAVNVLLSSPTFEQYRLPPAEYQSDFLMKSPSGYGSVIYLDLNYASKLINAVIYDNVTMEQYITENGIERNDWYSGSSTTETRRPTPSATTSQNQTNNTVTSENTSASNGTTSSVTSSEVTSSNTSSKNDTSSTSSVSSSDTSSDNVTSETASEKDDASNNTSSSTSSEVSTSSNESNNTSTEETVSSNTSNTSSEQGSGEDVIESQPDEGVEEPPIIEDDTETE